MSLVTTPAIVLSAIRYGETSKIVRLATRDHGVQSAIAKGALRPRSRFGAALQLLCSGQAQLLLSERRDLHTLTAFDVLHLPLDLSRDLDRYTAATSLAELVARVGPTEPRPATFDLLRESLVLLEQAPVEALEVLGVRLLWRMVQELGFGPSLDQCVRCGEPIPAAGELLFLPEEGGAVGVECAGMGAPARLNPSDRRDLAALVLPGHDLPVLDAPHAAAHRRLLSRFIHHHVAEGQALPALDFWTGRSWREKER
jgi:DNA repair protein RecO (recombination protein O)